MMGARVRSLLIGFILFFRMKTALLATAILALLCLVEGMGEGMEGRHKPKMGMERKSGPVMGRAGEQKPDGGFHVK